MSDNTNVMTITPGDSVGPFQLGMSVRTILSFVCSYEESPDIFINNSEPFITDIVVELRHLGFRLCFDGFTQELQVIIVNFSKKVENQVENIEETQKHQVSMTRNVITFKLKNSVLATMTQIPDLRYIYHVCGPTVPGYFLEESKVEPITELYTNVSWHKESAKTNVNANEKKIVSKHQKAPASSTKTVISETQSNLPKVFYFLKYSGISFRFPIAWNDYTLLKRQHSDEIEDEDEDDFIPFYLPTSESNPHKVSPSIDRLYVYKKQPVSLKEVCPWLKNESIMSQKELNPTVLWTTELFIRKGIKCRINKEIHDVYIGSTLQEIYQKLGAPDKVTLKDFDVVDVLRDNPVACAQLNDEQYETFDILGFGTNKLCNTNNVDYFYNYFHHGFDLLVCGSTHRVKKIIIHTNFPGHPLFGVYNRCLFKLKAKYFAQGFELTDDQIDDAAGQQSCLPQQNISDTTKKSNYSDTKSYEEKDTLRNEGGEKVLLDESSIYVDTEWKKIRSIFGPGSPPLLVKNNLSSFFQLHSNNYNEEVVRKYYGYPGELHCM